MSETSNQSASVQEASESKATTAQQGQDLLDQLLEPEVQESLTVIVENLPKLAELVTILTKSFDFAQSIATDKVLIDDFRGGFQEFLEPIENQAKTYASSAIEAKDRAETSKDTIGLFGLLRMLKDPEVQKVFRFVQAYLDISAERSKQK